MFRTTRLSDAFEKTGADGTHDLVNNVELKRPLAARMRLAGLSAAMHDFASAVGAHSGPRKACENPAARVVRRWSDKEIKTGSQREWLGAVG